MGSASAGRKIHSSTRKNRTRTNSINYKHILIPTDGSELSKKAVRYGIVLAKAPIVSTGR
jgi:hypothetical protein